MTRMQTTTTPSARDLNDMLERLRRMRLEFENASVRIGVVGESGTGKSSVINALFGDYVAEVGATETTDEPHPYERDGLTFVDLPGCGTPRWPASTYVSKLRLKEDYDAFLVVTRGRVMENDVQLYAQLRQAGKAVFVLRNQFDSAVAGEARKPASARQVEATLRSRVVEDLRAQLRDPFAKVYVTACLGTNTYDLEQVALDVRASLGSIKQARFDRAAAVLGEAMIEAKAKSASEIVTWYAAAAAANGLNPIPGLDIAVDLGLLATMNEHILRCFGLRGDHIQGRDGGSPAVKELITRGALLVKRYVARTGIVEILRQFGGRALVRQIGKYIPFIGQLIAAGIGYGLCVSLGDSLIGECREAAKAILDAERRG